MKPIIRVENLSKRYEILHERVSYYSLRDELVSLISGKRAKQEEFWALRDVNFEVTPGEVLGIIGPNGAGKSTLLKILSRITPPTHGTVTLRGRIGSLLEVGTGFHPELSGRENIFLNGAILGMTRKEIRKKFDEMVSFSGVEKFLDTPVKYYSSGMYVRLAFAVAAHMDPEILVIDEVLAVGDAEFQKKCLGKMEESTRGQGRTILFVSHNMAAIQSLCTRCLLLDKGKLTMDGGTREVVNSYLRFAQTSMFDLTQRQDRKGSGEIRFSRVKIEGVHGAERVKTNFPMRIKLFFDVPSAAQYDDVMVAISIRDVIGGQNLLNFRTDLFDANFNGVGGEPGCFECVLDSCPLVAGQYLVNILVEVNHVLSDYVIDAAELSVDDTAYFVDSKKDYTAETKFIAPHHWELHKTGFST